MSKNQRKSEIHHDCKLVHGDRAIPYLLCQTARRKRSIAIHVRPDGSIQVRAPQAMSAARIEQFLHQRADWIVRHLDRTPARPRPQPSYHDGALHPYLGQHFPLLRRDPASKGRTVELTDAGLCLPHSAAGESLAAKALERWYRNRAEQVFAERMSAVAPHLPWIGDGLPAMKIRRMRRQWGSCSRQGHISLNLHLIKTPVACIDYVLVHELCHLKEHNHGPRFYALMDRHMPEWQHLRRQLNELGHELLD